MTSFQQLNVNINIEKYKKILNVNLKLNQQSAMMKTDAGTMCLFICINFFQTF